MNDNDILLASQNGCELVLTTDGDFPAGSKVLYCGGETYDLTNLTDGTDMFKYNTDLNVDFDVDLPYLTNGTYMFQNCIMLASFSGDLPSLTNGHYMFFNCFRLASFTTDLPNLSEGTGMFDGCSKLTSFSAELPNLTRWAETCSTAVPSWSRSRVIFRVSRVQPACSTVAFWTKPQFSIY